MFTKPSSLAALLVSTTVLTFSGAARGDVVTYSLDNRQYSYFGISDTLWKRNHQPDQYYNGECYVSVHEYRRIPVLLHR